jgi:preprotein translocase subunit YajC
MKYTIDRFEDNFAVVELEDETFVNIPRSAIPREAKEGDVIAVMVDKEETEKREKRIKELEDSLFVD